MLGGAGYKGKAQVLVDAYSGPLHGAGHLLLKRTSHFNYDYDFCIYSSPSPH